MLDICDKRQSLRRARAKAIVVMRPETVARIEAGSVPKGDVLEFSRAAVMLGAKKTPDLLPFCHRIPLDRCDATMEIGSGEVAIIVEVAAIARTGVEVEAMTAASLGALNIYDMIKPIDDSAHIGAVQLLEKRGGKSTWAETFEQAPTAGVIIVSDSVSAGKKKDSAGKAVMANLADHGVETLEPVTVPDEPEQLQAAICELADVKKCDLVFAVGGTGLGPRDQTPEAVRPLFEREIPGLAEAIRSHGRERTPWADLSRCVAGQRGETLIVATPGSTNGAKEAMDAIMPWVLHIIKVFDHLFRHGK